MNIPFGDDKKRISNLELSQALREIFNGELSKLVEYKEKIKKIDDLIDTIDSDNIRTKIEQINGIIKVASFTDTEINYTLPKTLSSILETTKEDTAKTPAEELANMRSLISEFIKTQDLAKKADLLAKLQEATTTQVVTGIPVVSATSVVPTPATSATSATSATPATSARPVVPPLK
jgi:Asp-tRNA(Asn)/Glu-tRNA(Gln) amidotransferase C subunit